MSSTDPLLAFFFTTGVAIGFGHCIGIVIPQMGFGMGTTGRPGITIRKITHPGFYVVFNNTIELFILIFVWQKLSVSIINGDLVPLPYPAVICIRYIDLTICCKIYQRVWIIHHRSTAKCTGGKIVLQA